MGVLISDVRNPSQNPSQPPGLSHDWGGYGIPVRGVHQIRVVKKQLHVFPRSVEFTDPTMTVQEHD